MSFDPNVISAAAGRLEQRRRTRVARQEELRREILSALPRISELERQIQLTMLGVARAALTPQEDPAAFVAAQKERVQALQAEKKDLLQKAGFPADALENPSNCPLCEDRGWKGAVMCRCLEELCRQVQIEQLSSMLQLGDQSFEAFDLSYYPVSLNGASPRATMKGVYDICQGYAHSFPDYPLKNLYLTGAPGLGKTFLSAAIARVVAEKGYSVVYDTACNVFAQFEAKKFEKDTEAGHSTQRYLNCDLLILDDLGSEMTTAFTQSVLYEVVNARLISGRHTVISSNLSTPDLALRYQPQIYSRISGMFAPLAFQGEDIRQIRGFQ